MVLTALGRNGRYEDGAWLDRTHRSRFIALLQQAEARLQPCRHRADRDPVRGPCVGRRPGRGARAPGRGLPDRRDRPDPPGRRRALPGDCPHTRQARAVRAGDRRRRAPLVPVGLAVAVAQRPVRRRPGADHPRPGGRVRDHDGRRTGRRTCSTGSRPRWPQALAAEHPVAGDDRDTRDFRLGQNPAAPASGPEALLAAALAAPTWTWLGASRPNPLHRIGAADEWSILGCQRHVVLGRGRDGHPECPARSHAGPHAGLAGPRPARRRRADRPRRGERPLRCGHLRGH